MNELNDDQTRELNRDNKLTQFADTNNSVWTSYLPFKNKVLELKTNVASIIATTPQKEQISTGVTNTQIQKKLDFSLLTGDIFEKTLDYALETNNLTLQANVHFTSDEINTLKDTEILPFAINFNTNTFTAALMADAIFVTYQVTQANVDAVVLLANQFNSGIGQAHSIMVSSNTANTDINGTITKIRKNIASLLRLGKHFRITNHSFLTGLISAAKKDNIGIHHTVANVQINLDGIGVIGEYIIGTKTEVSNLVGACPPMYVTVGDKLITCKVTGKPDQTLIHHFIRGHMDNITFNF